MEQCELLCNIGGFLLDSWGCIESLTQSIWTYIVNIDARLYHVVIFTFIGLGIATVQA